MSRRWSEGPSEGIRRIRRGLPEVEPSDTADDIQDLRLAVERRSERADTAYPPRFREEKPSATAAYSGSAILTVVPSPILLDIVILPPSSAVRRSMPESP